MGGTAAVTAQAATSTAATAASRAGHKPVLVHHQGAGRIGRLRRGVMTVVVVGCPGGVVVMMRRLEGGGEAAYLEAGGCAEDVRQLVVLDGDAAAVHVLQQQPHVRFGDILRE